MGALVAVLADLLDPNQGPKQTGDFKVSPHFFVWLIALGFLIGVIGHITKARTLVAIGVTLIFLATLFIPIALNVTH